MWERGNHGSSRYRPPRPIEGPYAPVSKELREILNEYRKTIYQISADTGIDGAYIWRIVRGERVEVSREVLLLISIAMILDTPNQEKLVETANRLLDAGGYKKLRGRWKY